MPKLFEENRSPNAVVAERILRTFNDGHLSSAEAAEAFLKKRADSEDQPYPQSPLLHREHAQLSTFEDMQVILFGKKDASLTVLYLHGGAYSEEVLPFHVIFCGQMAERLQIRVVLPLYPLAPNHTWRRTFELLTALYREILAGEKCVLMGDSAGGGLAIALCQHFRDLAIPLPAALIGLSPWADVCMQDSDYEPYRAADPMLDVPGLQAIGKVWAGELDVRDPKVSPLFGDQHGLPRTLLFTGTREILYPDILKLYDRMREADVDVELVIGKEMNHVYPLYGLPESKTAVERIDAELRSVQNS